MLTFRGIGAALALLIDATAVVSPAIAKDDDRRGPPVYRVPPPPKPVPRGQWWDGAHGLAHVYPATGYRVHALPPHSRFIAWGGVRYGYWDGVWYAPYGAGFIVSRPPIGVVVTDLPAAAHFGAQHVWRTSPEAVRGFNSLIAVIIAFSVTEAAKYLILARDASKQGLSPFANDIRATMYPGVVVLSILGLQVLLTRARFPAWSELLICGVVAVALYAPAITNALRRISPAMSFRLTRRESDPRETQDAPVARPGVRQLRINFVLPTPDLSGGVKSNRLIGEAMVRRGHIVNILYPAAPETWPAPTSPPPHPLRPSKRWPTACGPRTAKRSR